MLRQKHYNYTFKKHFYHLHLPFYAACRITLCTSNLKYHFEYKLSQQLKITFVSSVMGILLMLLEPLYFLKH